MGFPVATGGDHAVGVFREMLFYSEAHGRLFALNSASDTVSVFAVDPNTGGLSALSYSPISVAGGGSWRCLAVHPSVEGVAGKYFSDCNVGKSSAKGRDDAMASKLWEVSEQIVAEVTG